MTSVAQPSAAPPNPALSSSRFPPVDLWQKALTTLDDDLKASLDFKNSTKRDILEKTLNTAEEKRQLCLRKRWKFKRNGRELVLRDILEKIIRWLDHFKAIGDVGAQYDPAHAALPWAGVRFLLKVAVSDTHVFGSTVSGVETVSHFITRYAIFEHVHIQRNTAARSELEPLLTMLYAELLTFLARAKKYFQTPTAVRMLKSALIAFQSDEDQQLQKIASQDAKVSAMATLSDAETLNRLRELEQPIHRVANQTATYTKSVEDARYRKILDWLSPVCFVEHQKRHSERRLQESGEWLLNHSKYLDWQSSSASSIFLLHGMAGSGKTSLASIIVDSVLRQSSNQASALLAYFYCSKNASEAERSDQGEIMRSIVRQLGVTGGAQKTIHGAILHEYERREAESKGEGFDVTKLSLQDCIRLILSITGPDPATIVLDAIDEVQENGRWELVEALQQILRDSGSVVKIFTTSRDNDQVLSLLTNALTLRIDAENNRVDMESFVYDQVALAITSRRLLGGDVSSTLRTDLSQALMDGAGEIFQLVIWQIEKLCDMRHEIDVQEAMRRFSADTLDRLYSDILDNIRKTEAHSNRIAINAFSLLLCLHEPLSPDCFLAALTLVDGNHEAVLKLPRVLRICFNLVTVDSNMNVLRFAHISVQEFLEAQSEFSPPQIDGIAATACLHSCLYSSPVGLEAGLSPKEHFYHYGVLYWAEHCKAAFVAGNNPELLGLAKEFMFDDLEISLPFISWLEDAGEYAKVLPRHHWMKKSLSAVGSRNHTPLFTLCVFGLSDMLSQMSQATAFGWNRKNDSGHTALYLACSSGQERIVRVLLDLGADVNPSGGRLGTPLQAACFEGYIDIVRLLIENGADTKSKGAFQNALQASIMGYQEEVAMLLLQNGFKFNDQSEYDEILQGTLQTGFVKGAEYLQRTYGPSFGNMSSAKCKAIRAAISKGQIGVVERFIQKILDPRAELPADSVAVAAVGGHDSMITLLLDKGLDIEHEGQFGKPLRSASLLGHQSTVRLLLDRDAKASARSSMGNALEAAAMNGHVSIASSLLQEGVDANIMGGSYGTALQAAAYRGHSKVAELLLDANADVYLSGLTKDAFHAAAGAGHENVIRLLLDRGYRFRSPMMAALCKGRRPPQYNDPLRSSSPSHQTQNNRHAFRRKKPETPEESSLHSDPRVSFSYKKNFALEEAASNGHLRIVEIILDDLAKHGAVISGGDIGKPLCKASGNGHEEVVKCFLGRNLDGALYLKQALCAAARKGHLGIVDTLTTHIRISLPVDGQTAEDVAKYCTEVEENILLPGCLGDHVPIVTRALDLMDQRCSTAEVKRIYEIILQESSKHDSCKVMDLAIGIAEFDNADLLMAIALTCEYGSAKALRFLLSKYPRHNPSSGSCETKCLSKVIRLSVGRAQPARVFLETLDYGLYISAFYGHAEVVKTLIQEGASVDVAFEVIPQVNWSFTLNKPDKISQTALQAALSGFETPYKSICAENSGGREAIVLLLLEHGANANQSSRSYGHLLNVAIMHCSGETVQSMIDKGASLMNDHSGRTSAIRNAAHRELGAAAVMKVLLQASGYLVESDPSNSDNSDLISVLDSALGLFSKNGEFRKLASVRDVLYVGPGAVVKMLLQLLPMEKVEDDRYGLLLQMAVSIDDRDWTNFLLARGVNVNGQGYYYGTALQCAARFGNVELVQLLLSSGAEVNILKGEHGTALRAAVKGGHGKVVDVLLQHDADVNLCSPNQGNRSFNPGPVLQLAFESRDIAILKSLIAAGAKLHTECSDRLPLLITACGLGDLAIVRLFLDNEVDVNPPKKRSPDSYRYPDEDVQRISMTNLDSPNRWYYCYRDERASALHMACSKGHKDIARVLLEHRADVQLEVEVLDAKGYYSKTPLQMAAHAGHLSVVQLLIDAGATIDHFNSHGTALSIASGENRLKVVEELLLAKATIFDPLGRWNSLAQACRSRGHAVLELLLDELPESLEAHACTNALSAAASAADDGAFQMLLLRNIPVSSSTLSQACAASLHNSISVLLQHGVDIDGDDGERGRALQVAAYCQTEATVDLLLDRGADVNTSTPKYGSPMQAALEGLAAIFLGAPPEFSTSEAKQVRIKRATYYGYYPNRYTKKLAAYEHIVRALLARGANPNPAPRNYGNPLHLAAFVGHLPIVQQLLAKGADLNSVSDRFGTALLAALEATKWDIAKLLLHTGIEVNHVSSKHGTALHYACKRTNVRMVHLLLDYGADPDRICSSHGSPLTASISGYNRSWEGPDPAKDVAEIILRHGNYVQIAEQDLLFAVRRMATADRYGGDVKGLAYGEEVVRLFLEHDQNLMATESILVAAVAKLGSSGTDTLRLLLQRDGGAGVKESIVEAARNLKIMKVLLNHRPICQVTPEAVYRFSRNFRSADDRYSYPWNSEECEIIRLLLDYEKDMPITSTVLSTVTGTDSERLSSKQTQDLIEYLFERNNQLEVTESVVKEARTADTLKILLKHAPNMKVTPELLSAAAELDVGYRPGTSKRERVLVLLAHDETATVPQSLAKTFPSSDEGDEETLNYLTVLLDRAPDLQLPSDYLYSLLRDRAFGGERTFMKKIKLLVKHNKTFEFTEDIREALEEKENFDPEQKALLYKLQVKGTSVPACG